VIAYAPDLKASVLGVPAGLLSAHGAVHPQVAAAMAEGARTRLGATFGVATTGVAGPDPADGQPVGTVYIAAASAAGSAVSELVLTGSRSRIREATVQAVLSLLIRKIGEVTGEETS
jgi:PncC family amidohydrolase